MRGSVPAAVPYREWTVEIANSPQQAREVFEMVGDDMDYLALSLHAAVAGDHAS